MESWNFDMMPAVPYCTQMYFNREGLNLDQFIDVIKPFTHRKSGVYILSAPEYFGTQIRIGRALRSLRDRLKAHLRSWPTHLKLHCLIVFDDDHKVCANILEKTMMRSLIRMRVKKRGVSWYNVPIEKREEFYDMICKWRYSML